ncbi:MAG: AgmX/PglI C-terminal domain-containing protein, partial [Pseudomonadota bacterium]|nr:AgmX/PglI C-terminal domain-containing protein [Pseudomonadota bacterium]
GGGTASGPGGGTASGLGGVATGGRGSGSGYGAGSGSGMGSTASVGGAPPSQAPAAARPADMDASADKGAEPEWGAEIHLSNDDSMSLASAQRLLWAAERGEPIEPRQVRAHEFLNYFGFATDPVAAGRAFSVTGSAHPDKDGNLTMALAVRGADVAHRPLDLTFVLDRSGSMWGEGRMEFVKRGLRLAVPQLERGDRLDLVLFDDTMCTPVQGWVAGRDDPGLLDRAIESLRPRSATNLEIGLREAYRIATGRSAAGGTEAGRNQRVVLITDALVNEGELDPDALAEVGKAYNEHGIRLTGIGVGEDFSDVVLDKLTEAGHGPYLYLGSDRVVDRFFGPGFVAMTRTLAHDVRFSVDLPESLAQARFYGEESSTDEADITPIDYQSGNAQLFLQDLKMRGGAPVPADPVTFKIRWKDPQDGEARTESWTTTVRELLAAKPANIHKARALMAWADLAAGRAFGHEVCGAPYDGWKARAGVVQDDAEVTWLAGITDGACAEGGTWRKPQAAALVIPGVELAALEVTGLEEPVVRTVLQRHSNQFRYCYERALRGDPTLTGQVELTFGVDSDGSVTGTTLGGTTLSDRSVAACVESRFHRIRFPKPAAGTPAKVSLTMRFTQ